MRSSVADPYIYYTDTDLYTDPEPALFCNLQIHFGSGSGSRLFYDTKINFLKFVFEFFQLISYFV